ncbi:MAG: histidinol-phosphate transaminase [Polyangiaceae bacterium]|nr:histidinol-phosphate transaminase [Polyangiaceae bacterium]
MSLVPPGIETLRPYEAGKPIEELAREYGVTNAIKLASNENPLGPSPLAIEAVRRAVTDAHLYPDAAAYRLRERLAADHGVSIPEVVHGNGSNEILDLLVRTFTTGDDHIVFAEPSFVVYRLAAMAHGVPFTAVPLRGLTHDLEAMVAAVTPRTKLLFVANPNNPTGTYVGRAEVERFLRLVPPQVIVVFDEAYNHYADAPDYPDCLTLRGAREHLVVVRTFSKIYGLAALRVGYAIAPPALIDYLFRVRQPFSVSSCAQEAALAALDDHAHLTRSAVLNAAERPRVQAALAALGYPAAPSQANFVYLDVRRPSRNVYEALLRRGVIVRPIGSPTTLRVTIGTPEQNDRFLRAFAEVMG